LYLLHKNKLIYSIRRRRIFVSDFCEVVKMWSCGGREIGEVVRGKKSTKNKPHKEQTSQRTNLTKNKPHKKQTSQKTKSKPHKEQKQKKAILSN